MRKIVFLLAVLATCSISAQVLTNEKGKCGYQDEAGQLVIPYKYDFIGEFNENGIALVRSGKKWGMISRTGEIKVPVKYNEIGLFHQGLAHLVSGKKYGLVNDKGEIVCKPQFQTIYRPNSDGIRIALKKKNNKAQKEFDSNSTYTVLNKEGKMLFPANFGLYIGTYDERSETPNMIGKFENGQDTLDTHMGLICVNTYNTGVTYDLDGNVLYDDAHRDAVVQEVFGPKAKAKNRNFTMANKDFSPVDGIMQFNYNQKAKNGKADAVVGYYDLHAQKIVKYYTTTYTKTGGILGTFTPDEKIDLKSFSEGFAVAHLKQYGNERTELLNKNGDVVATFPYWGCFSYSRGYAVAKDKRNKWGLIDSNQKQVLPYRFDDVSTAVDGTDDNLFICAKEAKKWGTVDLKNNVVIPMEYDDITSFIGSNAVFVNKGTQWGAFNGSRKILECVYDSLNHFSDGAFLCNKDSRVSVFSVPENKMSDTYDGFCGLYNADDELHNGTCWELIKVVNESDTVYGYVDGKADIVVPFVFENDMSAYRAYKYYRDQPTSEFGELELYRMRLRFTVRERMYTLDAVVPENHWDY